MCYGTDYLRKKTIKQLYAHTLKNRGLIGQSRCDSMALALFRGYLFYFIILFFMSRVKQQGISSRAEEKKSNDHFSARNSTMAATSASAQDQ